MDDKHEKKPEVKVRKPYTQDKTPREVANEICAKSHKIKGRVRELYMHDAKPIYIDKG